MSSGVSPKTPSHSAQTRRRSAVRPRRASLRCLLLSQNFSLPAAARSVAPIHYPSPHPPTVISPSDGQTRSHPRRGGAQADVRRRETVRTQSPREGLFCWFISARASVRGAPLPTPSRDGRNLPSHHLDTSFVDPNARFHRSRARFRTVTMVEKEPVGCPADWRRRGRNRVAGSDRLGPIAHDRWEVANVFSSEVVGGCSRGSVTFLGRVDVGNRAGRAFCSPATLSIFPLDVHLLVLLQHPVLDEPAFPREADQCRRPSACDRVPVGFVLVQTSITIDSRRPTREFALAGPPRATARTRHVGQFANVSFSDAIFFHPSSRRRQEAQGDQVDRVGGAEVLQRAQGTALTPKNAPDPRRVAVGPPIPHLPFPRVRRRRARKRRPPFFFHASRRPRR